MRSFIHALLLCIPLSLQAAPAASPARPEINALLDKLQTSGCEFNRNGTWHSSSDAKTHLLRKLEYLEDRQTLNSTEQFIELAASTSSSSGKPYLVRCAGSAPLPSKVWLDKELKTLRVANSK